ncbi:MAG: hypothetical protein WA902_18180, partial [Thermosynechococcaceae cyanobacterium]
MTQRERGQGLPLIALWIGLVLSALADTATAQSLPIAKDPNLQSLAMQTLSSLDRLDRSSLSLTSDSQAGRNPVAPLVQSSASSSIGAIDQGIAAYEQGRYVDAIASWQTALKTITPSANPVLYALTLNHLSLAHQQLGQLQAANDTITQSLKLLQPLPPSAAHLEVLAKVHNTQGELLWSQGQTEAALKTWQVAAEQYRQAQDPTGQLLAQLNQAKARQALGLQTQAVQQLQTLYQQLQQPQNAALQATGLLYLGDALLGVGQLETALNVLQQSRDIADQPSIKSAVILATGNVERALSERANSIGQNQKALAYATQAVQSYQQILEDTDLRPDQLNAQLNLLHLFPQMGRLSEAQALWPRIQAELETLPLSRVAIDARLNAVQGMICLYQTETLPDCGDRPSAIAGGPEGIAALAGLEPVLKIAIAQSQTLQDPIAKSYSSGLLGHLYELTGQTAKAQSLTQQALLQSEAAQAPEIAYRWHWQLGRLLMAQGQFKAAKRSYQAATEALETVRRDLLRTNPNTQLAFRDAVEPVYRQYVGLLLTSGPENAPNPQDLKRAIQEIDALQLSELENFLGCDLSAFAAPGAETIEPSVAIVYPILLPDRVALIYNIPGQPLAYQETLIDQTQVESTVAQLRQALTRPSQTPEVLTAAQQLHQWLIAPLEAELKQSQIKTLVFAADGVLRNIP